MEAQPNIIIKTALRDAVAHVNQGSTPTEALQKSAEVYDLSQGYIQRVGEALNVALTYNHFKTAEDKAVDFPIADISRVIKDKYHTTQKTAAQKQADQFPSHQFFDSIPNFNRILTNQSYKKSYTGLAKSAASDAPNGLSEKGIYEKTARYIDSLEKKAEDALYAKKQAEQELTASFSNITNHFLRKSADLRSSFAEFESQVYATHKEAAVPYLDLIYKDAGISEPRGVHDEGYVMFNKCAEAKKFDELVKAASELVLATEAEKLASETLSFERDYLKEINKAAAELKKNTETPVFSKIEDKLDKVNPTEPAAVEKPEDKPANDLPVEEKKAGLGEFSIFQSISDALGKAKVKTPGAKLNEPFDNPDRVMLLQRLLMTDPILSKASPNLVAKKYEQILRLAPQLSKEIEVVRALLRLMVSTQGLSTFEADQLIQTDANLMKQKLTRMGLLGPGGQSAGGK